MSNITSSNELISLSQTQPDLLQALRLQLMKDFGSGFNPTEISVNIETSAQQLVQDSVSYLKPIFLSNRTQFMSILYRVDLPEKSYLRLLLKAENLQTKEHVVDDITMALLNRALQKVLTRRIHRS
ncbi:MAG: hypothetical protein ACI8ZN_001497 [Bacteroidia bacterium]|jgi:hypothetical protein